MEYRPARHAAAANRVCQNLRAEKLPAGSKAPGALYRIEGMGAGSASMGAGPIRGLKNFNGLLFAVSGTTLYSINALGAVTSRGTIAGTGRVFMCVNQDQLTIANADGTVYCWNGTTLTTVADGDLPAVGWIESFDQYTVYGRLDGYGWGVSALGDTTAYDPLDVASAESQPDLIVRGIRNGREMVLFGERTTEPFYIAGGAGFPFERSSDGIIDVGCAAKHSPARADNTLYWLAVDAGGLSVRRLAGRTPERVSTPELDDYLDEANLGGFGGGNLDDAYGFSWTFAGHAYYALGLPATGATFVFDIATGLWQTRTSTTVAGGSAGWRINMAEQCYSLPYFGDSVTGQVGVMVRDTNTEFGDAISWETICAPVQFEGRMLTHASLELELDSNPKATARTVSMAWSDDDGETWSNEYVRSTPTTGKVRNRCTWTNLGSAVSRLYRFKGNGTTPLALIRSFVDVEVGG